MNSILLPLLTVATFCTHSCLSANPNYSYQVNIVDPAAHNFQGKGETRLGEKAEGFYSVVEPNGVLRTVTYISDEHGFRPTITYSVVGQQPLLSISPVDKTFNYSLPGQLTQSLQHAQPNAQGIPAAQIAVNDKRYFYKTTPPIVPAIQVSQPSIVQTIPKDSKPLSTGPARVYVYAVPKIKLSYPPPQPSSETISSTTPLALTNECNICNVPDEREKLDVTEAVALTVQTTTENSQPEKISEAPIPGIKAQESISKLIAPVTEVNRIRVPLASKVSPTLGSFIAKPIVRVGEPALRVTPVKHLPLVKVVQTSRPISLLQSVRPNVATSPYGGFIGIQSTKTLPVANVFQYSQGRLPPFVPQAPIPQLILQPSVSRQASYSPLILPERPVQAVLPPYVQPFTHQPRPTQIPITQRIFPVYSPLQVQPLVQAKIQSPHLVASPAITSVGVVPKVLTTQPFNPPFLPRSYLPPPAQLRTEIPKQHLALPVNEVSPLTGFASQTFPLSVGYAPSASPLQVKYAPQGFTSTLGYASQASPLQVRYASQGFTSILGRESQASPLQLKYVPQGLTSTLGYTSQASPSTLRYASQVSPKMNPLTFNYGYNNGISMVTHSYFGSGW